MPNPEKPLSSPLTEGDTHHPAADASPAGSKEGKEAKFRRIAEAVRNGTYQVDTDALARKLLEEGLLDTDSEMK